jgi:hypothetical protein
MKNKDGSWDKSVKAIADQMNTMDFLVLDGRGGGPGFCAACDRIESLGLTDRDGSKTDMGAWVLQYAKEMEEI